MKILAIIDPPHTLQPRTDTTLVLLRECERRGYRTFVCEPKDISIEGALPMCRATKVTHIDTLHSPALLTEQDPQVFPISSFDAVLIRKDPPFDAVYLWMTLLLEYAREHTVLYNDPRGLREANEKLFIFRFPSLIAPTIVHSQPSAIQDFLHQQGGDIVVKPLDGFGGQSIFRVRSDDPNTSVILETMTHNGQLPIMAQKYLPQVKEGDKRIILIDGEPIGTLLRLPQGNNTRSNLRAGGTAVRTQITQADRQLCSTIAKELSAHGLFFVGIDVIGGYLSEINVTSPTGIQVMNRLEDAQLETLIVDDIERRIHDLRKQRS